jgi:hypothetical protein
MKPLASRGEICAVTSLSPPLTGGLIASTLRGRLTAVPAEFIVFVTLALLDFRRRNRLRETSWEQQVTRRRLVTRC